MRHGEQKEVMKVAVSDRSISLRSARVNAGLKQSEAAERLGVTNWLLSRYERGMRDVSLKVAWRMSEVYGLPLTALNPDVILAPSGLTDRQSEERTEIG